MREMALQLKSKVQSVHIMNNNMQLERALLQAMLSFWVVLAIAYVLILGNMVFDIVARKAFEK